MKITKEYLRKIIKEEVGGILDEARLGVKRAAQDIAERFGGKFRRQPMHVSTGGGKKMATVQFHAVWDDTDQRNAAWDELLAEGEDIGPHMLSRNPIILWNGVKLYKLPFHYGVDDIADGIGVASKGKIDNIPESRGYTDAPGATSSRSHPKSYEGPPEIADIDIAWRKYGSDLYEQGQEDFLEGIEIISYDDVPEEYRDTHRFYLDGYFDEKNKENA